MTFIRKLLKDESGATAIEYGLIAALVSVAAITALTAMGGSLRDMFSAVSTELEAAVDSTSTGGTDTGGTDTGGTDTGGTDTGGTDTGT
ncbi:MAG: Flp family type IVb pilin [Acetobacterales bacterium]